VAVKKYQNNESGISTASTYERVIETLKFLSLPGNKHPNFIRFFEDDSSVKELGEAVWLEPAQQKRKRTTKDEFKYKIEKLAFWLALIRIIQSPTELTPPPFQLSNI